MESGLATTSSNSSRTLGCISEIFVHSGSLGDREPELLLQWEWLCSPTPCLATHPLERYGRRGCHWSPRQESCWVVQPHPCPVLPVFQLWLSGGIHLLGPSFSGWRACRSPSCCSFHPLPASDLASWPSSLCVPKFCLYTLPSIPTAIPCVFIWLASFSV